jgi:hypothetical protein
MDMQPDIMYFDRQVSYFSGSDTISTRGTHSGIHANIHAGMHTGSMPVKVRGVTRQMNELEKLQLQLIDNLAPISRVFLEAADSPRRAYYSVEVIYLAGAGYVIRKASGGVGAKPVIEAWFRTTYSGAMAKQRQLVDGKLRKKKGRMYREA